MQYFIYKIYVEWMVQHTYLKHIYANKYNGSFSMAWSSVFNNEVFSIYYTEKCCLFDQCFIYMLLFINIVSLFYFYILIEVVIYYVFAIFII